MNLTSVLLSIYSLQVLIPSFVRLSAQHITDHKAVPGTNLQLMTLFQWNAVILCKVRHTLNVEGHTRRRINPTGWQGGRWSNTWIRNLLPSVVSVTLRSQSLEVLLTDSSTNSDIMRWAGVGQSLERFDTGCTVRVSNHGGFKIFHTRPDWPWGPQCLLYNGYRVFPVGKAAGNWHWPSTQSGAEVKQRAELYLYSTSGPSWPVLGWNLPLPLLLLTLCEDMKFQISYWSVRNGIQ